MTMITPSAQLTLTKGNKSWSSTAVAAALELVDPPGCRNSHKLPGIGDRIRARTLPQALRAQGLLKEAEHVESQSAETVLTPDECQLLGYLDKGKRKRKEKAGSLQWAYMAIARLGGFMDSKRTGIASWGALW